MHIDRHAPFGRPGIAERTARARRRSQPAIGDAIGMDDWLRRDVGLPPRARHREPGLLSRL